MPSLRRESDGAGDNGSCVYAYEWDEDGNKKVVGHEPMIGCTLLVGACSARSYSAQDFWHTTVVTEILSNDEDEDGKVTIRFKTNNSTYIFEGYKKK